MYTLVVNPIVNAKNISNPIAKFIRKELRNTDFLSFIVLSHLAFPPD